MYAKLAGTVMEKVQVVFYVDQVFTAIKQANTNVNPATMHPTQPHVLFYRVQPQIHRLLGCLLRLIWLTRHVLELQRHLKLKNQCKQKM